MDPIQMKKAKAMDLLIRTMIVPKFPIIFGFFHEETKAEKGAFCAHGAFPSVFFVLL